MMCRMTGGPTFETKDRVNQLQRRAKAPAVRHDSSGRLFQRMFSTKPRFSG
jgi:hypothetical protein